jgi:hypothetical protein
MMKRYLAVAFVLCAASAVLLRAQASAGDAAMQADRQLAAAYEKGDNATVQKLLDSDFTWIDTDGIMMERPVAIMIQPTWGGKAYWSSRIFGNHNGFWKMEESYHTTIQAGPRMTAVRLPDPKDTKQI